MPEETLTTFPPELYDFGDAPEPPYQTLLPAGASHLLTPTLFLGHSVDGEPDGQPDPAAEADGADEDGVVFTSILESGGIGMVEVLVTSMAEPAFLWAWLDFHGDGWDQRDVIVPGLSVAQGMHLLQFAIPPDAVNGPTYARFRLSVEPYLDFYGPARSGEVEDYLVEIQPWETTPRDLGDAPEPYPTMMAPGGAIHRIVQGLYLGSGVDGEVDGQPESQSMGDDLDIDPGNPLPNYDDEDGITFLTPIISGKEALLGVRIGPVPGFLDGWIDYNQSGSWEPDEHIFGGTSEWIVVSVSNIVYEVPSPPRAVGPTHARFRFSSMGGLAPEGPADDGEVEDYMVRLLQPAATDDLIITNLTLVISNRTDVLVWEGTSNRCYQVERCTNLLNNIWDPIGDPVFWPVMSVSNAVPNHTSRVYRVTMPSSE